MVQFVVCNTLAEAHCLRTFCNQEAKPNSKLFIEDIEKALALWSNQERPHETVLLYHVRDLLSLKGYMGFHSRVHELIIRAYKLKYKKHFFRQVFGHASRVDEAFIDTLSKHLESFNYVDVWEKFLEK
ncbi:putative separase [Helianthus debilis subsp. tardiflorus]